MRSVRVQHRAEPDVPALHATLEDPITAVDVVAHELSCGRLPNLLRNGTCVVDPLVVDCLRKLPETHTRQHFFSQHILRTSIRTIDDNRAVSASFCVRRVLCPVGVDDGAVVVCDFQG